jgi:hypothetical protein
MTKDGTCQQLIRNKYLNAKPLYQAIGNHEVPIFGAGK